MRSAQPEFGKLLVVVADFLAAEWLGDIKHEYIDGQVYAISVASRNHDRIAGNVFGELRDTLRNQPCEAFASNVKVKVGKHSFYPDSMLVGEGFEPHRYYTETPVRIVEVLSKSTRRADETIKRRSYPTIPSLLEYVPIEQDIVDDEVCRRSEGWGATIIFLALPKCMYARVDNGDMRSFIAEQAAVVVKANPYQA